MNMTTATTIKSQAEAADKFRSVLSDVLPNLLGQVTGSSKMNEVKQALRDISYIYKTCLSQASTQNRSNWDKAANRCAYVFIYLLQHCNLVYYSLQSSGVLESNWGDFGEKLKVCSIGGGPGSDLVGLATFLQHAYDLPPILDCLVLDLYPNWRRAWDTIARFVPGIMSVDYSRCDLVRDAGLQPRDLQFVQDADIITLVKSFSAVAAFFRRDETQGKVLRNILREIKPDCHVLYIDNDRDGDTQFYNDFANPAGLELVFEQRGHQYLPSGSYSTTVLSYCHNLEFNPMRGCDVNIQLYRKKILMNTSPTLSRNETTSSDDICGVFVFLIVIAFILCFLYYLVY